MSGGDRLVGRFRDFSGVTVACGGVLDSGTKDENDRTVLGFFPGNGGFVQEYPAVVSHGNGPCVVSVGVSVPG